MDCGINPDVRCTTSGDPCEAMQYGCSSGVFFQAPLSPAPAGCGTADAADEGAPGDDGAATTSPFADDAAVGTTPGVGDASDRDASDGGIDARSSADAAGFTDATAGDEAPDD